MDASPKKSGTIAGNCDTDVLFVYKNSGSTYTVVR